MISSHIFWCYSLLHCQMRVWKARMACHVGHYGLCQCTFVITPLCYDMGTLQGALAITSSSRRVSSTHSFFWGRMACQRVLLEVFCITCFSKSCAMYLSAIDAKLLLFCWTTGLHVLFCVYTMSGADFCRFRLVLFIKLSCSCFLSFEHRLYLIF